MAVRLEPNKCGYTKRTHSIFNKGDNVLESKSDHTCKQIPRPPRASSSSASLLPLTSSVLPHHMFLKPGNIVTAEIDEEKICEVPFRSYIAGYF